MEYTEAANVLNDRRELLFPLIRWLTKSKFEYRLRQQAGDIHPFAVVDGDSNKRIYVGKTVPTNTDEGVRSYASRLNLEIVGTVMRDPSDKHWLLRVAHGSRAVEIKRNFLVLCIEAGADSFAWTRTRRANLPPFALRGALDKLTGEYLYIGKNDDDFNDNEEDNVDGEEEEEVSSFSNNGEWAKVAVAPVAFGKVHTSHACMYSPYLERFELANRRYRTLCLRPSPASLRVLARQSLRRLVGHSNRRVQALAGTHLPATLVAFVKYPSHLHVGEHMLANGSGSGSERLVRDDGAFEMLIEDNDNDASGGGGDLVCRAVEPADRRYGKRVLAHDVRAVRLYKDEVVFELSAHKFIVAHHFQNNRLLPTSGEYRFGIEYSVPSFSIDATNVNNN